MIVPTIEEKLAGWNLVEVPAWFADAVRNNWELARIGLHHGNGAAFVDIRFDDNGMRVPGGLVYRVSHAETVRFRQESEHAPSTTCHTTTVYTVNECGRKSRRAIIRKIDDNPTEVKVLTRFEIRSAKVEGSETFHVTLWDNEIYQAVRIWTGLDQSKKLQVEAAIHEAEPNIDNPHAFWHAEYSYDEFHKIE